MKFPEGEIVRFGAVVIEGFSRVPEGREAPTGVLTTPTPRPTLRGSVGRIPNSRGTTNESHGVVQPVEVDQPPRRHRAVRRCCARITSGRAWRCGGEPADTDGCRARRPGGIPADRYEARVRDGEPSGATRHVGRRQQREPRRCARHRWHDQPRAVEQQLSRRVRHHVQRAWRARHLSPGRARRCECAVAALCDRECREPVRAGRPRRRQLLPSAARRLRRRSRPTESAARSPERRACDRLPNP